MSATELIRIERTIRARYDGRIKLLYGYTNEDLPLLTLVSLVVPASDRRQGLGTLIMNMLCREADAYGWLIELDASSRLGTNIEALLDFYSRFDFVVTGNNIMDEPVMMREPMYTGWYPVAEEKQKDTFNLIKT